MICFCWFPFKYYTQKHLKTRCFLHVFLYMYLKTVKNLQFLLFLYHLRIASKRKKWYQLLFDLFPYNSKKTSSFPKFQNSKNIWGDKPLLEIFGILENSRFFWNFVEFQKNPGILVENLKKTCVFLEFHSKFQKNLRFFAVFGSNSKKSLGFFGILQNSKKTSSFPKFQNSKNIWGSSWKFWIFGILENSRFFWNFGTFQKNPRFFWIFGRKP